MICKKCNEEKAGTEFYVSDRSTCKACVRHRVKANRDENAEYYRSYDRFRYRTDEVRKQSARKCAKSQAGIESRERSVARRRKDEPEKFLARNKVEYALRKGRIIKADSCYFCGSDVRLQAHHHDYTKPLDVFWLCSACHGKLHTINGDFHRGEASI